MKGRMPPLPDSEEGRIWGRRGSEQLPQVLKDQRGWGEGVGSWGTRDLGATYWPEVKLHCISLRPDFPGGSDGKASAYNPGDPGSIPGSGRSPGEGNGNPLQYSCLENPMDRGAW